jgi:hypothetical protein
MGDGANRQWELRGYRANRQQGMRGDSTPYPILHTPPCVTGMDMGARAMIPTTPIPLILDEEGRAVDTAGKTVQPLIRQPTIKANIRAQQRASFKRITEQVKRKKPLEKAEDSVYFDPRVNQEMTARSRRTFKFNEPGGRSLVLFYQFGKFV